MIGIRRYADGATLRAGGTNTRIEHACADALEQHLGSADSTEGEWSWWDAPQVVEVEAPVYEPIEVITPLADIPDAPVETIVVEHEPKKSVVKKAVKKIKKAPAKKAPAKKKAK